MEWKSRTTWVAIGVAAVAAWILNHVLDMTVSGVPIMGRRLLSVITLGSAKVRDAPYSSAALNPYPVAPLLLISLVLAVLIGTAICVSYIAWRTVRRHGILNGDASPERGMTQIDRRRKVYDFLRFSVPVNLVLTIPIMIQIVTLNEAVLIRRVFEADRDILSPYLSKEEYVEIQAEFCGMTKKSDYDQLMAKLTKLAANHNVKLRNE